MDLAALTLETFAPLVGDSFTLGGDPAIVLALESATPLGARPGDRDPFSLVLRGPREPVLPQATYRLEHAVLGTLEIFVVPIGSDAEATRYEAIFN